MNTKVGKIAKMIITNESPETPIQRKLGEVGKTLGLACLGICVFIFFIGLIKRISPIEMFMTSVGLAVAAIPEGLPAIVTIVLSIGVTKMAKKNSIIRKLPAVETLGSSSVICSDKTGTLTQNKMQVVQVVTPIDIGKNLTISSNNYFNNNVIDKHNSNNFLKNNSNVIDSDIVDDNSFVYPFMSGTKFNLLKLKYEEALKFVTDEFIKLKNYYDKEEKLNPIEHIKSRIKNNNEIVRKLVEKDRIDAGNVRLTEDGQRLYKIIEKRENIQILEYTHERLEYRGCNIKLTKDESKFGGSLF